MNDIQNHVDFLFRKYKRNSSINDLRLEILGNLEAKRADLMDEGMDEFTATKQAIASINSIDYLIDSNRNIWLHQFQVEVLQHLLIYLAVAWIITMPLHLLIRLASLANHIYAAGLIITGIFYLAIRFRKRPDYINAKQYVNLNRYYHGQIVTWIIWGIYFFLQTAFITAIHFGSNIWFGRQVKIPGPYAFAQIAASYLLPLTTIVLPLIINKLPQLVQKYEVDEYEN